MNYHFVLPTFMACLLTITFTQGQHNIKDPDEFLIGNDPIPKVLLVGTFHFAYYGHDAHKTAEENKVDILSKQKQKEVKELVDYVARFKPTKLVVESKNSSKLINRYNDYKQGNTELRANEIDQIGFRLMDKFDIDTLYGVDDWGLLSDLYAHKDSTVFKPFLNTMFKDWDFQNDDEISKRYEEWLGYDDQLALSLPLKEYFMAMNSDKFIKRGHGAYLVGDFKLGEYRGADALAIHWYTRNLRIFRNIQKITESANDRILVLYGAGHLAILKQLFESTPEYELIDFDKL